MRTLYARLSLALLAIMLLIGGSLFVLIEAGTRLYYEEITQRLNAPIAMYVTGERQLIRDGMPRTAALEALASQAMVINPSVEIYLLDPAGRVLAHGMPSASLVRDRVDLAPVLQLLAGDSEMPIR